MELLRNVSVFVVCALLLPGCGQGSSTELEGKLADALTRVEGLEGRVNILEGSLSLMDPSSGIERFVILSPSDEGYSVVKTDIGFLTVQLEDIKPYASGSKVTLKFGNPMAATIQGLGAKLEWGPVGAPRSMSRKVSIQENLRSGAWTQVNVVLEGIPPAELGYVRLSELATVGTSLQR